MLTIYIISAILTCYPSLVFLSESGRKESWKKHGPEMGPQRWTAATWLVILTPIIPVLNTIMAVRVIFMIINHVFGGKK